MSSRRISIVQYLNTAPLVRGFTHGPLRGKYALSFTVPSQCAEALRTGAVDVAILPAIEYQRIPGLVILPNLSISSLRSVRSLLLIARQPIARVRRLALDRSSRSTQMLVRILCHGRWKIAPQFFEVAPDLPEMFKIADAALLIGDPALKLSLVSCGVLKREADGALAVPTSAVGLAGEEVRVYDIVEQWRAMTNAPAVMAVWAARKEAMHPELVQDFQDSLAFGLQHLDAIAAEAAAQMRLPASELRRYLTENIDYRLDREHRDALLLFYELAAKLGQIDGVRPIRFAAEASGPVRYMDAVLKSRMGD